MIIFPVLTTSPVSPLSLTGTLYRESSAVFTSSDLWNSKKPSNGVLFLSTPSHSDPIFLSESHSCIKSRVELGSQTWWVWFSGLGREAEVVANAMVSMLASDCSLMQDNLDSNLTWVRFQVVSRPYPKVKCVPTSLNSDCRGRCVVSKKV